MTILWIVNIPFGKNTNTYVKIKKEESLKLYPSLAPAGTIIKIIAGNTMNKINADVLDMQGRKVSSFSFTGSTSFNTSGLKPGVYRVRYMDKGKVNSIPFVLTK